MSHLILYPRTGWGGGCTARQALLQSSAGSCSSVRRVGMEVLCSQSSITAFMSGCQLRLNRGVLALCVSEETDCALLALQGVLGWEVSPVGRAGLRLPQRLGPALLGCLLAYILHRVLSE